MNDDVARADRAAVEVRRESDARLVRAGSEDVLEVLDRASHTWKVATPEMALNALRWLLVRPRVGPELQLDRVRRHVAAQEVALGKANERLRNGEAQRQMEAARHAAEIRRIRQEARDAWKTPQSEVLHARVCELESALVEARRKEAAISSRLTAERSSAALEAQTLQARIEAVRYQRDRALSLVQAFVSADTNHSHGERDFNYLMDRCTRWAHQLLEALRERR